jgi:hypothetical protein
MRTFLAGAELLDPYPFFAEMRQQQPVAFDEQASLWSVYRHGDVVAALGSHESFSSSRSEPGSLPNPGARRFASLVAFDPPYHTQLRKLVSRAFTSSAVARLVGRLQPRRKTLTWWRSTAFSSTSSRRDRTASTATAAISPACLRGANCDHSRSMRARTEVRMRETLGKRIRHLEHKRGSRSSLAMSPTPAALALGCAG